MACTSPPSTISRSAWCVASDATASPCSPRSRLLYSTVAMKKIRNQQEDFIAQCRAAGLSVTQQRLAIFEAMMANGDRHPSAEVIYQSVRERYPTTSFNTIYKNLETFEEL